jgi:hypothetical protein
MTQSPLHRISMNANALLAASTPPSRIQWLGLMVASTTLCDVLLVIAIVQSLEAASRVNFRYFF